MYYINIVLYKYMYLIYVYIYTSIGFNIISSSCWIISKHVQPEHALGEALLDWRTSTSRWQRFPGAREMRAHPGHSRRRAKGSISVINPLNRLSVMVKMVVHDLLV